MSQFKKIARRNKERLRLIQQEVFLRMASLVIERSPVDTGLFRNNWFVGINAPNTTTTDKVSKKGFGEKGGARYNDAVQLSPDIELNDTLYFTNSLPYARRLEFGHSQKMAPHGMLRLTVGDMPEILREVATEIR